MAGGADERLDPRAQRLAYALTFSLGAVVTLTVMLVAVTSRPGAVITNGNMQPDEAFGGMAIPAGTIDALSRRTLRAKTSGLVTANAKLGLHETNNMLMSPRNSRAVITGQPLLTDHGNVHNMSHAKRLAHKLVGHRLANRRRSLQESSSVTPLAGMTYLTTIPVESVAYVCALTTGGVVSLYSMGVGDTDMADSTQVVEVKVLEFTGCPDVYASTPDDPTAVHNVSAVILLDSSVRVEVHCVEETDGTKATCAAFYDQATAFQSGTGMDFPPQGALTQDDIIAVIDAVYANGTDTSNGGRRLQQDVDGLIVYAKSCIAKGWPKETCLVTNGKIQGCESNSNIALIFLTAAACDENGRGWGNCPCCLFCDAGWIVDGHCGCKRVTCFPSAATVEVQGKGTVRMDDLRYGDKVRSVDRSGGGLVWRDVYLFGHRETAVVQPYVTLRTAGGGLLRLSATHFMPVCVSRCDTASPALQYKYARDVAVGDLVVVAAAGEAGASGGGAVGLTEVAAAWVEQARGAFNPFVRGADILVDGVLASPHSDWLLDGVTPASLRHALPAAYELLLAPVYWVYRAVGPAAAEWLAQGPLRLAERGGADAAGLGYFTLLAAAASPLLLAGGLLAVTASSGRRRV